MSKFRCFCGDTIRDQTDNLPYKAEYFADEDYEAYYGKLVTFLRNLVDATEKGEQETVRGDYPKNLDISDFISDTIAGFRVRFGHNMILTQPC